MTTIPAIAGTAQAIQRPGEWTDPADAKGPIELMVEAARAAAQDAGAPALLGKVGWVGVVGGVWRYRNPGQVVADQIGAGVLATALSMPSGSSPQELVGLAARRIADGEVDVALVVGGEATWSARRIAAAGGEPKWIDTPGEGTPERVSVFPPEMTGEGAQLGAPANAYALFEDSLRSSRGETIDQHRTRLARLWEGFSAVAARNPFAWDTTAHAADAIREPSADNRMIAFPYTKAMVANNTVNMASAILLCSPAAAAAHGVEAGRLVFPHAVTLSHETWQVINRDVLHEVPGVAAAGRAAMAHARIGPDDLAHIDLYACFPSIVQMSCAALGIDPSRELTVTGGLGFAGAPLANSSGQGIAAIVPLVRDGGWGFVHANGGFATKHAFGVYANHPPKQFVLEDCQALVKDNPRQTLADDFDGKATIEAATVVFGREGPSHVLATLRGDDGRRAYARTTEDGLIAAAMSEGLAGTVARRRTDGTLEA